MESPIHSSVHSSGKPNLDSRYRFFDAASTTKCCEEALETFRHYSQVEFANPSSQHLAGRAASSIIDKARATFAQHFKVEPNQVIFTSGGTESDNLAILGVVASVKSNKEALKIFYSSTEHPAVTQCCASLKSDGLHAQPIDVDSRGQIVKAALDQAIASIVLDPTPLALFSIHHVNNITGALIPIEFLAQHIKSQIPSAVFHSDCVQSFCKTATPVSHKNQPIDLLSISGHKVHSPKGIGALIVLNKDLLNSKPKSGQGLRLLPTSFGGGQEGGFRSGTQSPALIAAFAEGMKYTFRNQQQLFNTALTFNLEMRKFSQERKLGIHFNSGLADSKLTKSEFIPHIINLSVPGFPGATIARLLEEKGFLVSTGSACHSSETKPDPVLEAMKLKKDLTTSAIRVSIGDTLDSQDFPPFLIALEEVIIRLRALKPGRR